MTKQHKRWVFLNQPRLTSVHGAARPIPQGQGDGKLECEEDTVSRLWMAIRKPAEGNSSRGQGDHSCMRIGTRTASTPTPRKIVGQVKHEIRLSVS